MSLGKVIIVEDDTYLLKYTKEMLELEGFTVKGTTSALDFFQLLTAEKFNVAIIDIGLPDKSGFEIIEYLRENTNLGLIILTAREAIKDKIKGYDSGTDYYFVKPVNSFELVAAIKNLVSRLKQTDIDSKDAKQEWFFDHKTREIQSPEGVFIELTSKEQTFLACLAEKKGNAITRKTLMTSLDYNCESQYGNRALDVLVVRLRKKLKEQSNFPIPIKTVHGYGYSFNP